MKLDDLIKLVSYETLFEAYISNNISFKDMPNKLGITSKDIRKLLTYYNIKKDPKLSAKNNTYKRSHEEYLACGKKSAETQKKHWAEKSEEEKLAWAEYCREAQLNMPEEAKQAKVTKTANTLQNKSQEEKDLMNAKRSYSCKKVWAKPETRIKYNNTIQANRIIKKQRICRSLIEQNIYDTLKKIYSDIIYDNYIDDRYPFNCDFYIPSLDIFIEIQGHPSHGNVPYGFNSESYKRAEELTGKWRKVYIESDVIKYNTAIKNGINLIRLYPSVSLEMNYKINDNKYNDLVKLLYDNK